MNNEELNFNDLEEEIRPLSSSLARDVIEQEIDWIVEGYIPRGVLAIFGGRPETGKSYLACKIASELSNGKSMDGQLINKQKILYLTVEDSLQHVIKNRLNLLGADMDLIHLSDEHTILDDMGLARLAKTILEIRPDIVFIDTLSAYNYQADDNKASEVLKPLKGLTEIAREFNCTIIGIKHLNKTTNQTDYMYRLGGSVAFAGMARIILMAGHNRNTNERILFVAKSNLSAKPEPMLYEITDNGLSWKKSGKTHAESEEFITLTMQGQFDSKEKGNSESAIDQAVDWIKTFLAKGEQLSTDVSAQSKISGIAPTTLERAKTRLGITPYQKYDKGIKKSAWWWGLSNVDVNPPDHHDFPIYKERQPEPLIVIDPDSQILSIGKDWQSEEGSLTNQVLDTFGGEVIG